MHVLELSFSDDPARLDGRPAHRERLADLNARGLVLGCGPYADDTGALLIFLTDTLEEAQALIDADPYYTGPGVEIVSLREWNPVTRHTAIAEV